MFQLTKGEWNILKSKNATSSWGGRRSLPYVFTEHGVLMLSSILKSDRAIEVNIQIMRVFTKMRAMITDNKNLTLEIEENKKRPEKKKSKFRERMDNAMKQAQEQQAQQKKGKR